MPSGRTHTTIDFMVLAGISIALFHWHNVLIEWLGSSERLTTCVVGFYLAYLFSMFLLSPDLDLDRCRSHSSWGILRILWYPYSKIFRHRGISHSIIFGIMTRILYLVLIIVLLQFGLRRFLGIDIGISVTDLSHGRHPDFSVIGAIAGGLYVPDVMHIILDRLL